MNKKFRIILITSLMTCLLAVPVFADAQINDDMAGTDSHAWGTDHIDEDMTVPVTDTQNDSSDEEMPDEEAPDDQVNLEIDETEIQGSAELITESIDEPMDMSMDDSGEVSEDPGIGSSKTISDDKCGNDAEVEPEDPDDDIDYGAEHEVYSYNAVFEGVWNDDSNDTTWEDRQ